MNNDFEHLPFEGQNKKRTKYLLFAYGMTMLFFLTAIFSWAYENNKRVGALYKEATEREQLFKKYRTANRELVAVQEQRFLETARENMELVATVNRFKSIQGQVSVSTDAKIKDVLVPYPVDVVKYVDTYNNSTCLKLPTRIERSDSFFSLYGYIGIDGLEIDSMSLPNELTITTGRIDGGFLKRDKYVVEVKSNNPYIDIVKMNNTQFAPKKKAHKTWGAGFLLGAILGIIAVK